MKKRKAGMFLAFVVATLVLVVGYAAVTDINLSVSGTASAGSSDANFDVQMVADSLSTTGTTSTVSVTDNTTTVGTDEKQLNVEFSATGFTAKGDQAVITYTIENTSNDLEAILSSTGVNITVPEDTDDTEYYANGASLFTSKYYFGNTEETQTTTISSEENTNTTTVTVVLTLNETILNEKNVVVNVNLPITAKAN